MPDNWNKLADLLGTPSINPIERKSPPARTPSKSSEPAVARVALESDTRADTPLTAQKSFESPATVDDAPSAARAPAPETKSIFKTTWDAVADLFGVAAPAKQEPEPEHAKPTSSFWPSDERPGAEHRASQQASDQLLGRKGSSSVDSDLEALLSGFKAAPAAPQEQPQPSAREAAPRREEAPRREREEAPRREFRSRNDRNGRPPERDSRPPRRAVRDSVEEESPREPAEPPRRKSARVDLPPRDSNVDSEISSDRRGPRRRPRREAVDSDRPATNDAPRREVREVDDTTIDRPRRGPQRQGGRDRNRSSQEPRPAPAARPEAPRSRTSAWEDPELIDDTRSDDVRVESEPTRERGERDGSRRRRRPRRPIEDEPIAEDDGLASTGRQIYGQHADEEEGDLDAVEALNAGLVVPWVEAISGIIDKNMKNHRNAPSGPRGGRGGGHRGGGGGERRR